MEELLSRQKGILVEHMIINSKDDGLILQFNCACESVDLTCLFIQHYRFTRWDEIYVTKNNSELNINIEL